MKPFSTEPVTLIEEVFPQDTNSYDTLFGGRLLSVMDKAAGIACSKFAHREFVTISIDTLTFKAPARQGDLIEVTGQSCLHKHTHRWREGNRLCNDEIRLGNTASFVRDISSWLPLTQ